MLRCHGLFRSFDCRQMRENPHPEASWIGRHIAERIAIISQKHDRVIVLQENPAVDMHCYENLPALSSCQN
jgi:hypothetical protein